MNNNPQPRDIAISNDQLIQDLMEELDETSQGLMAITFELESAKSLYQSAFDNAFDGIYQADLRGHYTMINASASEILGYANASDVVARIQNIGNDVYGDKDYYQTLLREVIENGFVANIHSRIQQATGESTWISENLKALRDDKGVPYGYQGIMRDISGERLAEDNLRLIAKVFEHGVEGIFITDADIHILRVNRAFTVITGFAADDVVGKDPTMLASAHHDNRFYTEMWRAIARHGHWSGEIMDRRRDNSLFTSAITITEVRDGEGAVTNYIGIFSDITDRKESEIRIHHLAYYDMLTGLPNRTLFNDHLDLELKRSKREQRHGAVIFIDLDNFKDINDSHGHRKGDSLLAETARRLKSATRETDTIARLGGDEFTVLVSETNTLRDVDITAHRILEALGAPFVIEGSEFIVTASIGVSLYPQDGQDRDTLLKNADIAMYRAKERGKNAIEYFTEELNQNTVRRIRLESNLRQALLKSEFVVHYQPQYDLVSGTLSGVEALIRWPHSQEGALQPSAFIPVAEECGMIDQLCRFVMSTACTQARQWLDTGVDFGVIAINISPRQFKHGKVLELIKEALESSRLPPHNLEVEITESVMMSEPEESHRMLTYLRDMGVSISIDDFGTGFSSLNYLKRLPVNALKIDKGFIMDITRDSDDRAITAAIIDLSRHLGLGVIAEGIESMEQMTLLKGLGCHKGQGYLFSKPVAANEISELVRQHHNIIIAPQ